MDVVCLGILVADIFSSPVDSLPAAGELKLTDRFLLGVGGCAANTAACLRRLERTVRVLGKVGEDFLGDFVLQDLRRLGIETATVTRSHTHPTSSTFILNVRHEDRRYIHCIGANADFTIADVDAAALDGARALYVGGYILMPGFGPDDLARLFREAKRRSLITALDVVIPAGTAPGLACIENVLPHTDIFLPNQDEARALTGRKDPADQAEVLARINPDCAIVITQGEAGAVARQGNEAFRAGRFDVESIDESGAGDAFAAGFLTGRLQGWPLEYSLRFASAVGASCTRALGCIAGVFSYHEAVAFVDREPLEILQIR